MNEMTDERERLIALALVKIKIRQDATLSGIPNLKREIGNLVKEPEMISIKARPDELLEFFKNLLIQIFTDQMKSI